MAKKKRGGTKPAKGTKFNPRTMFKNKYGTIFFRFWYDK